MEAFIRNLPKVELHIHLEGSLEPELMFELAKRNKIDLPFKTTDEVRAAYEFTNLQSFLDIYYQGANVLQTKQDFYDLTWAYLLRCKADNVLHTEVFFDPQTHTDRGIAFDTVIEGITSALDDGKDQLGISSKLIMCFLRHLSEKAAFETLEMALPYKDKIVAVGLDSSESGHPPEKFMHVFDKAVEHGFLSVAHAGEEGPSSYIWDAMNMLHVSRIDHGVRCSEDDRLMRILEGKRIPLTVCPLSNIKLCVFKEMSDHNIVELLRKGLCVTINSDDPAYFGGYMNDNFLAVAKAHSMTKQELAQFSLNAIEGSFLSESEKEQLAEKVNQVLMNS